MANNNDGGAAFPSAVPIVNGAREVDGLTKRDWFAGQALAAWIRAFADRLGEAGYSDDAAASQAAHMAVKSADALLHVLREETNGTS